MRKDLVFDRCCRFGKRRLVTLFVLLALTACSSAKTPDIASSPTVTLADFPEGIGRGYPTARLPGDGDKGNSVQIGAEAPDFAIVLEDGGHLRLSNLRGRPVVINFWATWCGPCRLEMPELMRAARADPHLAMLAVNVQEAKTTVAAFAEEFAMTTPVVIDPEGVVQRLYEVRGLPTTVFIDTHGRIAAIYAGILTPTALEERLAMIR
ncbi:MAG: TlpA family protein disulfide reductase [Caldilinea sp.]